MSLKTRATVQECVFLLMKSKDRNSNFKFNKMKENTRLKRNVNDLKLSIKILNVEIEVLREENKRLKKIIDENIISMF